MIDSFNSTLLEIFEKDQRVVIIGADDGAFGSIIRGVDRRRYVNVGISECNAIGMAAGMAACGKIPFVIAGGTFLAHRANEFIRDDVCMQKRNVKIVAIGAGLAINALGNTQHMTEDLATMRVLPNLTVVTAASPMESSWIAKSAHLTDGPFYIRLGRHEGEDIYKTHNLKFEIGKGQIVCEGRDLTIISTGTIIHEVLTALPLLIDAGISPEVINIHTIKPIDKDIILRSAGKTGHVMTVEEGSLYGGVRGAVSEIIAEKGLNISVYGVGLDNRFATGYGSYHEIKATNHVSARDIFEGAKKVIKR